MTEKDTQQQIKKGFFAKIIDKLDKRMQEKSKAKSCCNSENKSGQKSCCS